MNRQTLLRVIVLAVAAIIAVLLIIGIVMAITRTGLFTANETENGRTRQGSSQTDTGSSNESTLPGDTASPSNTENASGSSTSAPSATTGSIPSTGPSDAAFIAVVSLMLFGGTYATVLRFSRR